VSHLWPGGSVNIVTKQWTTQILQNNHFVPITTTAGFDIQKLGRLPHEGQVPHAHGPPPATHHQPIQYEPPQAAPPAPLRATTSNHGMGEPAHRGVDTYREQAAPAAPMASTLQHVQPSQPPAPQTAGRRQVRSTRPNNGPENIPIAANPAAKPRATREREADLLAAHGSKKLKPEPNYNTKHAQKHPQHSSPRSGLHSTRARGAQKKTSKSTLRVATAAMAGQLPITNYMTKVPAAPTLPTHLQPGRTRIDADQLNNMPHEYHSGQHENLARTGPSSALAILGMTLRHSHPASMTGPHNSQQQTGSWPNASETTLYPPKVQTILPHGLLQPVCPAQGPVASEPAAANSPCRHCGHQWARRQPAAHSCTPRRCTFSSKQRAPP
jgi:hypothetical protein